MACIRDKNEPYWCEADWKCKDCPNWMEDAESEGMTREEAKQWLEWIKRKYIHGGDEEFDYKRKVALDMAIKALEQEPILDKIRAEIIELRSRQNVGVLECLDIIDKYKAESEEV